MSKLDREIKAVIDDIFAQGEALLTQLIPVLVDEDTSEDEKMQKLQEVLVESKPKTYDTYIADLKNVFKQNGWTES